MPNLNLQQLARYLHLPEPQVKKLVDRGSIPGRRVNSELVFSKDEVHRWLEKQIGISDEAELVRVEDALNRSIPAGTSEETVLISSLIPEGAVVVPLSAKTRDSVIRSMVDVATGTGLLWDGDAMTQAVKEREDLHSTALESGVALLHSRRPLSGILGDTHIILGITPNGIPFGGGYGNLTDVFFLICSMDDRIHLRILTRLSRILSSNSFLTKLRELTGTDSIRDLIKSVEETME